MSEQPFIIIMMNRFFYCLVFAFTCIFIMNTAAAETVKGDLEARFADVTLEYEGHKYRERSRVTTVLIAGIDRREYDEDDAVSYRNGGQADYIMLLAIDDDRDTIQPIQISRDTMTDITVINVMGEVSGTRYAQICLAYAFGDGNTQSCELLSEAVSRLMAGIEIDNYYAMNLDSIAAFNDMLGGVEVVVSDDFTGFDERMAAGEKVLLEGSMAELYVRGRTHIGDQTDASRQNRQQQYMEAAVEKLAAITRNDPGFLMDIYEGLGDYAVTDMGRGRLINIANQASEYELMPIIRIAGESVLSDKGYMEFYPDEDQLIKTIIDTFYQYKE